MRFPRPWIQLKRNPGVSLPTIYEDHRGQLRLVSGDDSATRDALYLARSNAGTMEWAQLLAVPVGTPTITVLPAAGTTGAVSSVSGNDTVGTFTVTPGGASIAAGSIARITFAVAKPNTSYTLFLTPATTDTRSLSGVFGPTNRTTASVDIDTRTALTSGVVYTWGYLILSYAT